MDLPQAAYPKTRLSQAARLFCYAVAAGLIIMATAQLITFEKFVPIMQNYQLFDNPASGKTVAGLLVISEVMAVPLLLRMRLSRLMRWLSLFFLSLAALGWLGLGVWAIAQQPPLLASGIVGSLIKTASPILIVLFGALLTGSSAAAIYLLRRDLV